MRYSKSLRLFLLVFSFLMVGFTLYSQVPKPTDHFGFKPGTDKMLIDYEELMEYLEKVEETSPRMNLKQIGESPMGKPMYIAFFSAPENIENLERLKEINKELALNDKLSEEKRDEYVKDGKVFFVATLSMHASEVGPSQSAPLIAYKLATTQNEDTLSWLNDVVYMMVPSHNPDGMNMIVNHYKKYKGTKYEGSSMPGVYHKYVGHDNNRDFITLTQEDNAAVSKIFSHTWFPQVMVEKHQMGSTGPRYFVPPNHDPIAENIDAGIWNWMGIFGMNMIKDMTRENLEGISQHYAFDNYWPGSTETSLWKNVISFLTEAASVKSATPIYVESNELSVWGKGLSEYKKSINMPLPWDGGWWRLSDIVEYEMSSTMSIIKTCANHKTDILKFRNNLCKKEVERGKTEPPYYYIFPREQHDESALVDLVNLLDRHGVKRYLLDKPITIESTQFNKGDVVIPLAQPFRPFIKEVLEKQNYPVRYYTPGGEIIKPYDITSWSLPYHKGVKSYEIETRHRDLESSLSLISGRYLLTEGIPGEPKTMVLPFHNNESYKLAFRAMKKGMDIGYTNEMVSGDNKDASKGGFVIEKPSTDEWKQLREEMSVEPVIVNTNELENVKELEITNIGLIETYMHDMDAGWTRYVFDSYHIPYEVIRPGEIPDKDLEDFDLLIFPDEYKSILLKGNYEGPGYYRMSNYPPEYSKGMGKEGVAKILKFVNEGGKVITWGNSTDIFMGQQTIESGKDEKEEFELPISNQADKYKKNGLYVAGALVNVKLDDDMVYTTGMQSHTGVFYRGEPVFSTSLPIFDMDRRVMGHFTDEDILISGYAENIDDIAGEPALVWVKKGKGEMVFFSFAPQFRASTTRNYKLIFNTILFSGME